MKFDFILYSENNKFWLEILDVIHTVAHQLILRCVDIELFLELCHANGTIVCINGILSILLDQKDLVPTLF